MIKRNIWIILGLLLISLTSAHHDSMPQGLHGRSYGQIMQGSDISEQDSTSQISNNLWVIILLAVGIIIWFVMRYHKKKEEI